MNVIVTGAASGLGRAIANGLIAEGQTVIGLDRNKSFIVTPIQSASIDDFDVCNIDRRKTDSIRAAVHGHIHALINCAGINQNEWFEDVMLDDFETIMHTNAFSIVAMTQAFLESLKKTQGCVINIVSNAAHIPMTSSLAYNASKAAALMITRQMAHELTPKYGITVFSISPNKLEGTGMSRQIEENVQRVRGWTREFAQEYQRKSLMHGLETPPEQVASFIVNLLASGNWKYLSGCDIPFGK